MIFFNKGDSMNLTNKIISCFLVTTVLAGCSSSGTIGTLKTVSLGEELPEFVEISREDEQLTVTASLELTTDVKDIAYTVYSYENKSWAVKDVGTFDWELEGPLLILFGKGTGNHVDLMMSVEEDNLPENKKGEMYRDTLADMKVGSESVPDSIRLSSGKETAVYACRSGSTPADLSDWNKEIETAQGEQYIIVTFLLENKK